MRSHPVPGRAPKPGPEQWIELGRLLRQDPRMWAPVGQTPVVRSAGRHVSTNLISAVAGQGTMWFTVYGESLNAARFVGFCRRLLDDVGGPAVLVVDGHPVHRAREATRFVAGAQGRVWLGFLPGYSPQLTPDEWVWKNAKHDRIGPAGLVDEADLQAKAEAAMCGLPQHSETIRGVSATPIWRTSPRERPGAPLARRRERPGRPRPPERQRLSRSLPATLR